MMARARPRTKGGALTPADFRPPHAPPDHSTNPSADRGSPDCGSLGHGSHDDRRAEPRIPCEREIAILPFAAATGDWEFQWVGLFDCSRAGLGLIADAPMPVGSRFAAKLKMPRVTLLFYIVRHCTPYKGKYKIGAALDGTIGGLEEAPIDPAKLLDTLLNPPPEEPT